MLGTYRFEITGKASCGGGVAFGELSNSQESSKCGGVFSFLHFLHRLFKKVG